MNIELYTIYSTIKCIIYYTKVIIFTYFTSVIHMTEPSLLCPLNGSPLFY